MNSIRRWFNLANPSSGHYMMLVVLLSIGVFVFFSGVGCDSGCPNSGSTSSKYASQTEVESSEVINTSSVLNPKSSYAPGETVSLKLAANFAVEGGTITWYPPEGASNFVFEEPPESGGPPFVFWGYTASDYSRGINVSYSAPDTNGAPRFTDGITTELQDEEKSSAIVHTQASPDRIESVPTVFAQGIGSITPNAETITTWNLNLFDDVNATINSTVCEELVAFGQSQNAFTAYRLPVADTIQTEQRYDLPVVIVPKDEAQPFAPYSSFHLLSGPLDVVIPMEVRLDATGWANANLPSAPGELWVAVGGALDENVECPIFGDRDGYSVRTNLFIDLNNRSDRCLNCSLPAYYCYKTLPAGADVAGGVGVTAAQPISYGEYTCLGPSTTKLVNGNNWHFSSYTASLPLQRNADVHMHYYVQNYSSSAQTFNLAASSTLSGVTWEVYQDEGKTQPVGAEITVPASGMFHLHIFGKVPADAVLGQYLYSMTLSGAAANPSSWEGSTVLVVTEDGTLPDSAEAAVQVVGVAGPNPATAGQPLTYTFTVTNNGPATLTGLTLTDTLPANTTYASCSGGQSCANNSGTVTWTLADLPPGEQVLCTLEVTVAAGLPNGTLLTNLAYSATATGQSVSDAGEPVVVTVGVVEKKKVYLPLLMR